MDPEEQFLAQEMAEHTAQAAATAPSPTNTPEKPEPVNQYAPEGEEAPEAPTPTPQATVAEVSEEIRKGIIEEYRNNLKAEIFGGEEPEDVFKSYSGMKSNLSRVKEAIATRNNPFVDDEIKGFNSFIKKTGIRDMGLYNDISKYEAKEVDPLKAMVLSRVLSAPNELRGREEAVEQAILNGYGVDSYEDLKEDPIKFVGFIGDSAEARNKIESFKEKMTTPDNSEEFNVDSFFEEHTIEEKNLIESWDVPLKTAFKTIIDDKVVRKKLDFSGTEIEVEVPITPEMAEALREKAMDYVTRNKMALTNENAAKALKMSYETFMGQNVDTILKGAISQVAVMTQEQRDNFYHNIAKVTSNSAKPGQATKPTAEDQEKAIFESEMRM